MTDASASAAEPSRKAATRSRVLKAAGEALRAQGPERLGVAAVMREAGLTHGGFYAHFASKDALVAEALRAGFDGGARFRDIVGARTGRAALERFIDAYVSPRHRDAPEHGCPLAVTAAEVARQAAPVRDAFAEGYAALSGRIAGLLPPQVSPSPEGLARSLLAEMAGAVALARAVGDRAESDRILAASREALKARLPLTPSPPEPAA